MEEPPIGGSRVEGCSMSCCRQVGDPIGTKFAKFVNSQSMRLFPHLQRLVAVQDLSVAAEELEADARKFPFLLASGFLLKFRE